MQIIRHYDEVPDEFRDSVVVLGNFDGVHRGHWEVLQEIRQRALATGRRSVLLTFDPHPLRILRPEHAPPLLTTSVEKKEILAESGLNYAVFLSFTPALSRYEPRRFVEEVLVGRLGVKELVIGYDHGFGLVLPGVAGDRKKTPASGDHRSLGHNELNAGIQRLLLDRRAEFRAGYTLGKSWVVLYLLYVDDLGSAHHLLDNGSAHTVARGVYPGGHPRQTAAHYQNVEICDQMPPL